MNKKKNEVKNPAAIAGAVGALIMFSALADGETGGIAIGAILLVVAAIIAIVKLAAAQQRANSANGTNSAQQRTPYTPSPRPKTGSANPVQSFDFRRLQSTAAPGAVHTDKRNKYLAQLDGFLANGIIDRSEYNYLVSRYTRNNENS